MRHARSALLLFIAALLLAAAAPQTAEELTGKVIGVTDGDTITVLVRKESIKVRLEGIDAPESGQSFGTKSKQALSELVFGKEVTVKKTGTDQYGRTLGIVIVGGVDANAKMLKDGWAWHFKKYNDESRLAQLEDTARKAKRGLWSDENALAPWDYRTRQKTERAKAGDSTALHWLNSSSSVRHNESCRYFKNTKAGRLCGPGEGKACGICGG